LAQYESTNAARKMMQFVDEQLSNWYIRLCRRRFWKGDYTDDKISAYQTLYECLTTMAKLMAPIAPFFADWLYLNLNKVTRHEPFESVHLALIEPAGDDMIDKDLEERMDYAQRISSLVLSLRKKHKINVRQPLQKVILPVLDEAFTEQLDAVKDLIKSEVNVKEIEYLTDASGLLKKRIKPNFKTLGKRLGPHMKAAQEIINNLSQADINAIEKNKEYILEVGGTSFDLNLEDFEIAAEDIPGWLVANDGPLTVALDITLTPALVAEGMARELVNRIQNIRKTRDFNVTDRIQIDLEKHPAVEEAVAQFGQYIKDEVLAVRLDLVEGVEGEVLDLPEEVVVKVRVELA
jgi:isoleucyl-tRNA synthetase